MRVYIAAATSERQFVKSYRTLYELKTEEGDLIAEPGDYLRGDITRIRFGKDFLENKQFDAILLLDMDMRIPADALEKLRSHDLDMVSGHYFKRGAKPMMSVCSVGEKWPYEPLYDVPTSGLHKITNTGFGCVLIKREVVEAVNELLGEDEPIFSLGPMPEMANGSHGRFGSDFRFFARARALGYELWLDASVECPHATTLWTTREFYNIMRPHQMSDWMDHWKQLSEGYGKVHGMDKQLAEVRLKELREALKQAEEQRDRWDDKAKVISGQIAERENDILFEPKKGPIRLPIYNSEQEVFDAIERGKNARNDSGPDGQ